MIRLPRICEILFSCADAIARCCPCTRDDLFETGSEPGSWTRPNSVVYPPDAPLPHLTPPRGSAETHMTSPRISDNGAIASRRVSSEIGG